MLRTTFGAATLVFLAAGVASIAGALSRNEKVASAEALTSVLGWGGSTSASTPVASASAPTPVQVPENVDAAAFTRRVLGITCVEPKNVQCTDYSASLTTGQHDEVTTLLGMLLQRAVHTGSIGSRKPPSDASIEHVKDDRGLVVDVVVDGSDLAWNLHSQLGRILAGGGSEALIARLQRKIAAGNE